MSLFNTTKIKFKSAFTEIIAENDSYEIGEAAFPAYAHTNPLIDWLFWERIKVSLGQALDHNGRKKVLDFGGGSGLLSYLLANKGYDVICNDVDFRPLNLIKKKIDFPDNIEFLEGDILGKSIEKNSIDIIYALDVLEHIDNLDPYIEYFENILSPNGIVIVSGPTENFFYKIGRKIAGKRFEGDYHVSNIKIIKEQFNPTFNVVSSKKLAFPIYLFEIFTANKRTKS